MEEFEIRASNIATALQASRQRIEDFGYEDESPDVAVSRINGMFVTWLTSCEEARHQAQNPGATFNANVIQALPRDDDPSWQRYIQPKLDCSLRERVEAYWGIRIAYTHGDGQINLITSPYNRAFATNAPTVLAGVAIIGGKLELTDMNYHVAVRSFVQLRAVLP